MSLITADTPTILPFPRPTTSARIRFATTDDEPALLTFLDRHWRGGHVFVRQPELLRWQHGEPGDPAACHFVLGVDESADDLLAVQGFLPLRRFDPALPCHDHCLAIWKIRDDAGQPGLGLKLYQHLLKHQQPTMVAVIGLSRMVIPLYRALGFQVGLFEHHVCFDRQRSQFEIADGVPEWLHQPMAVSDSVTPGVPRLCQPCARSESRPDAHGRHGRGTHLDDHPACRLDTAATVADIPHAVATVIDQFALAQRPQKSWAYLAERYLRHPVYDYRLSWLSRDGQPEAAFVWRRITVGEAAVLRIVDVCGSTAHWPDYADPFQQLLRHEDAEYIDLYHHGLSAADLEAAGFVNRRATPGLIVPNYFQPYQRQNVELDFGYRFYGPATGPVRLFRGDADQDRPNEPLPFRSLGQ
jgi:hypothetical protein